MTIMKYFSTKTPLLLSIVFIFIVLSTASAEDITYHNGPILTGDINLSILWYGQIPNTTKSKLEIFINSMSHDNGESFDLQVSTWWDEVAKYQTIVNQSLSIDNIPNITLKIATQVLDENYSLGKELNEKSIPNLLQLATDNVGNSKNVAIIFISEDVTLQDSCQEKCFQHGAIGDQVYILIKNPIKHCPQKCVWPFNKSGLSLLDHLLTPPNDLPTDVMIAHLASALASTVTNPYGNGFYAESSKLEIGDVCIKVYGSDAFPGYPGKFHIDPSEGKAFNGHGLNYTRFFIPGIRNPSDGQCWTLL